MSVVALSMLVGACTSSSESRVLRFAPTPVDDPSSGSRGPGPAIDEEDTTPEYRPVFRTEKPREPEVRKARSGPPPRRIERAPRDTAFVPSTRDKRRLSNAVRRSEASVRRVERDLRRLESQRFSREFNDPSDPRFRDRGNPAAKRRLIGERNLHEGNLRSLRRQHRMSQRGAARRR